MTLYGVVNMLTAFVKRETKVPTGGLRLEVHAICYFTAVQFNIEESQTSFLFNENPGKLHAAYS